MAARLEITPRTVRRDVTRLRSLGYPIYAEAGIGGGYRLGPGGRLPPLLLDDSEAVAIAIGLRVATTTTVSGVEEAAISALAKLHQVLPRGCANGCRDRRAHDAVPARRAPDGRRDVLVTLAAGCRHIEGLRFRYRTHGGRSQSAVSSRSRSCTPVAAGTWSPATATGGLAYLPDRPDRAPVLTGSRYRFDDPPDPVALVAEGTGVAPWDIKSTASTSGLRRDRDQAIPPGQRRRAARRGHLRAALRRQRAGTPRRPGHPHLLAVRNPRPTRTPCRRPRTRAPAARLLAVGQGFADAFFGDRVGRAEGLGEEADAEFLEHPPDLE